MMDEHLDSERRAGPRVPREGTLRVGPARAQPYATLSMTDLSRGGIFIEADRPVKVGARFSAELELSDGQRIYIPEAEVAYNRDAGGGFGIRFLDLADDVKVMIDREVDRLAPPGDAEPPTLLPDEAPDPGAWTDSIFSFEEEEPAVTRTVPRVKRAPDNDVLRATARRAPNLWLVLMGLGAAFLLAALTLVIWAETSAAPVVVKRVEDAPLGMSAETHEVLMEEADVDLLDPEPLVPVEPDLAPLPLPPAGPAPEAAKTAHPFFPVKDGVRVLKAYTMKSPARFVVDLTGLQQLPELEGELAIAERVRFGLHEGFSRVVFDLSRAPQRADARVDDGRLQIILE